MDKFSIFFRSILGHFWKELVRSLKQDKILFKKKILYSNEELLHSVQYKIVCVCHILFLPELFVKITKTPSINFRIHLTGPPLERFLFSKCKMIFCVCTPGSMFCTRIHLKDSRKVLNLNRDFWLVKSMRWGNTLFHQVKVTAGLYSSKMSCCHHIFDIAVLFVLVRYQLLMVVWRLSLTCFVVYSYQHLQVFFYSPSLNEQFDFVHLGKANYLRISNFITIL